LNELLIVLMLVEILHTVRISIRSHVLAAEPFLVVGLIASIRRILVITLEAATLTKEGTWTSEGASGIFNSSMIELGLLGLLVLVLVMGANALVTGVLDIAVAIRLRDPALLREAAERLQRIPGAQVVTLTEMMGTFLNLVGAVRTLLLSIVLVAVTVSVLGVFNTLLAAVVERTNELSVMRALGASRLQIISLIIMEALLLNAAGCIAGIFLSLAVGSGLETVVKHFVPLAPAASLMSPTALILLQCVSLGAAGAVLGGLYPAWRASQMQPAEALKAGTA